MGEWKAGDRCQFRAGRGWSQGRIVNLLEGMAQIETHSGKSVFRKLSTLKPPPEAGPQPPAA